MLKLIIGNRAYSSWSMRGWLALRHSELEFEELVVPLYNEEWNKRREGDLRNGRRSEELQPRRRFQELDRPREQLSRAFGKVVLVH